MPEEKEGKKKSKEKIALSISRQSVWENPKILTFKASGAEKVNALVVECLLACKKFHVLSQLHINQL